MTPRLYALAAVTAAVEIIVWLGHVPRRLVQPGYRPRRSE